MSEHKESIRKLKQVVFDLDQRRKKVLNLRRTGKITKELLDEDMLWAIYEGTRFNILFMIDVKKILRTSNALAWVGISMANVAIILSVVLK